MDMDGYMNIWILKPTAGSRGIGIHICRTLAYVLRIVSERKTYKYIIQKYIGISWNIAFRDENLIFFLFLQKDHCWFIIPNSILGNGS